MNFSILTIFPEMFESFLTSSILGRAIENGLLQVACVDIRAYSDKKHHNTDDYPFGGGDGMVMLAQPILDAMRNITQEAPAHRVLLSPRGRTFTQTHAERLAEKDHLVLLCGHYEGVDERVSRLCIDEELSIGDYVLTGGEPAAMVIVDAVARLLPGVLGSETSAGEESFANGLLEYPQYTRPRAFEGLEVPEVLLGGNHAAIEDWRLLESIRITAARRPDLLRPWLAETKLGKRQQKLVQALLQEIGWHRNDQ